MSKEVKIFNKSVGEFKYSFKSIIKSEDIRQIKENRDLILEKLKSYINLIDKDLDRYKEMIFSEFSKIVLKNISEEGVDERNEFNVEKLFSNYINTFWEKYGMKYPIPFITDGWGGADLIISNKKEWIGDPESDISIYTNDYRFVIFTEEVYRLCHEITNYLNKYDFFERIGLVLKSHLKENADLVMTKKIYDELCNSINEFIQRELSYIKSSNENYEISLENLKNYILD